MKEQVYCKRKQCITTSYIEVIDVPHLHRVSGKFKVVAF